MKRSLSFLCSLMVFWAMLCLGNTAFASYINVLDESGYASTFVSTGSPVPVDNNDYIWANDFSTTKNSPAHATVGEGGSYVYGAAQFDSSYTGNSLDIFAQATFAKHFLLDAAPNEYLVDSYADSRMNFSIGSDYGRTGDVVEASVGLYSWAEGVGEYSNYWNDIEVEIYLREVDTNETIFRSTFINRSGGQTFEEIQLQTLLQYDLEYEAYVYANVWSNEDFSVLPNPEDFYFGTLDILSFELSIDLGAEPLPDVAPVPEPSTLLLLGSGLFGLAWYGRKRKKA